jgi:hypothetical protein
VPNLTDILVQKLPEGLHFDTKVKNFGMRVGKSRKTWMVVKGENGTKITLGHYPDIALSEARKLALDAIRAPTWSKPRISFLDPTGVLGALSMAFRHRHGHAEHPQALQVEKATSYDYP